MKAQPEFELQKSICKWISIQYPKVLFLSDTIASVKLTIPQQVRNSLIQKKAFKAPDLIIFESNEKYNGLFIELKVKSPFKKNGELLKDEHLEGQQKTINDLKSKGYFACFSWGFEMTTEIINKYMAERILKVSKITFYCQNETAKDCKEQCITCFSKDC